MSKVYIGHTIMERDGGETVRVEYEFNTKTGDIIETYEEQAEVIAQAKTIKDARKQLGIKSHYKKL